MLYPKKIISFLICLFCFSLNFEKVNLLGLNIDYLASKITFVILLIASIINYRKYLNIIPFSKFIFPLIGYFICLTIVNFLNVNSLSDDYFDVPLFINIIVFIIVVNASRFDSKILLKSIFSFSLGNVLLTVLYFMGVSNSSFGGRQTVFGLNQNVLGMMLVASLFTILYLYQKRKEVLIKNINMLMLFLPLILFLIIKTGSRTAFISAIIAFFIFLFFSNIKKIKKYAILLSAFFASVYLWIFYLKDSLVISRLGSTVDSGDLSNRDIIWAKIFKFMEGNYLFGIGRTGYTFEMTGVFSVEGNDFTSPHNVIIEIISYTGFLGLIIIAPFFYHIFRNSFLTAKINRNYISLIYFMIILALIFSGQLLEEKYPWILLAYIASSLNFIINNKNNE